MNHLTITRLSDSICLSIESPRGAMQIRLTPEEAERAALRLRKYAKVLAP